MIAWWDADSVMGLTALDRLGTHHGSMLGGVQIVPGMVGNAFEFDGLNVIEGPYSPALVPTTGLTLEAWVRPNGTQVSYARLAGIQTDNNYSSFWVFGISSHGGVYFGAFRNLSQSYIDGINPLPSATWSHIAATWDGTLMRAYVNGVVQPDAAAISGPLSGTAVPFLIGRGTSSRYGFRGSTDELTLYGRGLSGGEISAIFAAGPSGKCK